MTRNDLDGKIALVTGGADGIGLATARLLVRRGARVAILDRDGVAAKAAAMELGESRACAVPVDVTDRDAMRLAIAQVVERFGRLDLVVANAGITPPPGTLRLIDPDAFDKVIAVNLTGVLNTVQPAVPALIENGGHVVVVASCAAFSPPAGGAAYMISKAGVEVLARAFRLELAQHGVSVTTAYFGIVETGMARATLDDDPVGRDLQGLLPRPLRRRITAAQAAEAIVTAAERRRGATMAPVSWLPLSLGRGVLLPLLDRVLVSAPPVHRYLDALEARTLGADR